MRNEEHELGHEPQPATDEELARFGAGPLSDRWPYHWPLRLIARIDGFHDTACPNADDKASPHQKEKSKVKLTEERRESDQNN